MSKAVPPTILIIIGITGDLSRRYLLPAIEQIVKVNAAPEEFRIIGITRRNVSQEDVLAGLSPGGARDFLKKRLAMYKMDLTKLEEYQALKSYLAGIDKELGAAAQRLFYLSVPPQISQPIVELLGESGLGQVTDTKLLLEKPFGTDLASAQELITQTKKHFMEEQLYRIDHYLAKEMAQNLVVFREANALFKRTWSNDFIESIEIEVSEQIGIEGRAAFYEQTGALRDIVQSHLLQLAALTLMETPPVTDLHEIPSRRLEALKQLNVPTDKPLSYYARRGQYKGYKDEVGNPDTTVETYASLTLHSTDPKWVGVPIKVVTGKALPERKTEITITFRSETEDEPNQLVMNLQPNEGIELRLWTKALGYEHKVERRSLKLDFKDQFTVLPNAYEHVLVDAINSSHMLFTTSDEVLETWRILQPIQQAWEMSANDLVIYNPGSLANL